MIDLDIYEIMDLIVKSNRSIGAYYISQQLNISQATIGRRLKQMQSEGYLEKDSNRGRVLTEKGKAYYEKQKQSKQTLSEMNDLAGLICETEDKRLLEIVEIRKNLECMAVELACTNITEDQMKELDSIMLCYAVEVRHGGDASDLDLELHLKIAQYSGNESLCQIIKVLLTTNNAYSEFSLISYQLGYKTLSIKQHDAIVNAIKNRDCKEARAKMYEHLNQVCEEIKKHKKN